MLTCCIQCMQCVQSGNDLYYSSVAAAACRVLLLALTQPAAIVCKGNVCLDQICKHGGAPQAQPLTLELQVTAANTSRISW